ncbi:Alpha-amylase/subtilisin inhibitor [Dichanthelium oligosanthes]|uniref:Alpha-amylase/subtilisin inhibitor n=1 Tax=Dichanthelium oligosanthes TaxID=888268 RepID=A0A1E5V9R0_9POAL|nr:Alpha-amylase/subtilisin inhibitor [Dichanthelium oligosanthes]
MGGRPGAAARLILLLLSAVLAVSLIQRGAAAPSPVYDTDGHELSADADYYVLPAARDSEGGGGLTMAPNVFLCPLYVAQEADPLRRGFPVRLTPLHGHGGDRTVRVSFDVGVHFAAATTCVQTTEWHVSGRGDKHFPSDRRHVVTGPVLAPTTGGREKVFRVERHSHGYKLVWCGVPTECQDLGVYRDDRGRAWLTVSDQPHVVVFKKALPLPA